MRPFEQLNHCQLKEELRARQIYNFGTTKKDAWEKLHDSLRGVRRVPSLLMNNPTQKIEISNLQSYTILECEPLHDVKGHLSNILEELPYLLEIEHAVKCKELLDVDLFKKDTKTGADYRLAAIHQLSLLHRLSAPHKVIKLMETVVVISELLYSDDSKRSPQTVLRLYNTTFLHHKLCKALFQETKKTLWVTSTCTCCSCTSTVPHSVPALLQC